MKEDIAYYVKHLKLFKEWGREEVRLFFGAAFLIFIIRFAGLVFTNFTETAFLKRFGVEFLPYMYMVNPIVTILVMAGISGVWTRHTGYRILSRSLLACAFVSLFFRLLIPLDPSWIYPVLFVLKVQFEVLLGVVFWNLANDLFNLNQSKRLFPLITAGGVIGDISGSFVSPVLADWFAMNNLPVVYTCLAIFGALTVRRMERSFPSAVVLKKKENKPDKGHSVKAYAEQIRNMVKSSALVPVLILLTFFANIVLVVMNFQFNFVVDARFETEAGMLAFFGIFRGAMNMASLVLLFYSSRFYGKFGLPAALLFHPVNYVIVFTAFLFRFDVFSAMYARFSTNVMRTVFNKPVQNILIGIFPESVRVGIRPFLKGVVVRAGLITGSLVILAARNTIEPSDLSVIALPVSVLWILTVVYLKKKYADILSKLLSANMLDLKSMEKSVAMTLFRNRSLRDDLVRRFREADGEQAVLYARIMKYLSIGDTDDHILYQMQRQDTRTAAELMSYLSADASDKVFGVLKQMIDIDRTDLTLSMIRKVKLIDSEGCADFYQELMDRCRANESSVCGYPEVKGYAAACLFSKDPGTYGRQIELWMNSLDTQDLKSGVIALGEIGDPADIPGLKNLYERYRDTRLSPVLIDALYKLNADGMNEIARDNLSHRLKETREAALNALEIRNDHDLQKVIELLSHDDHHMEKRAADKIRTSEYRNSRVLIESLSKPSPRMREHLFRIIEEMDIKDIDIFHFFKDRMYFCYVYTAIIDRLEKEGKGPAVSPRSPYCSPWLRRWKTRIVISTGAN